MYKYAFKPLFRGILVTLIILIFISTLSPLFAIEPECYSWYCMRTKDHTRPKTDAALTWVNEKEYNVVYLDPQCTDQATQENRVLYLTFDVGYENGNVSKILDVLKEKEVPGAFFLLSHVFETEADLIKRIQDEGHLLCNHTVHHKDMSKIKDQDTFVRELTELESICMEKTGHPLSKFYRPPEGKFTKDHLLWAKELGYQTVLWSFAYADWDNDHQPSQEEAIQKITENLHNGAILLLHPTSATNAAVLGEIIDYCHEQGYRFESLTSLKEATRLEEGE